MEPLTTTLLISFLIIIFYTIVTKKSDISLIMLNLILLSGVMLCKAYDLSLSEKEGYILLLVASLAGLLLFPHIFNIGKK